MPSTIRTATILDGLAWIEIVVAEDAPALDSTEWTITDVNWANNSNVPLVARAYRQNGQLMAEITIAPGESGTRAIHGNAASRQLGSIVFGGV